MGFDEMLVALHHSAARGPARDIVIGLASHYGRNRRINPAQSRLSIYAGGISEENVRKALRKLEQLGEIAVRKTGAGRDSSEYAFLLSCPIWCDGTRAHNDLRKTEQLLPLDYASPLENEGAAPSKTRGQPPQEEGGTPLAGEASAPSESSPKQPRNYQ